MPKLNDLQLILLSNASTRDDASLLPFPGSVERDDARLPKAIAALIRHTLIVERDTADRERLWREDGDQRIGLFLTEAGRTFIAPQDEEVVPNQNAEGDNPPSDTPPAGDEPAPSRAPGLPRAGSKAALVLDLLHRPEGATLAELVEATSWLAHTTRAALTGLRQKGHAIEKTKRDEVTCYRIAAAA